MPGIATSITDRPDVLAQILAGAWRATPAATACKWSAGQWQRQPHLSLISEKAAAMAEKPLRLIVSVPPGHGKSELASHWLPIWTLANWPTKRIAVASYSAETAVRWGRKVRRTLIDTPDIGVRVSNDRASAHDWDTTNGGGMITLGIGGPLTGRRLDLIIIDDPIKNRADANSPTIRERTWDWWTSTARTRLEPGGSIIVVMTRWHEDDLVGRLLKQMDTEDGGDDWDHIRLPALAEPEDPLGRAEGEPLWPDRYDADALAKQRVAVGPNDFAGLFQQRPVVAPAGAFEQQFEIGPQPDDGPFRREIPARLFVHEGAAAGGHHRRLPLQQPGDHPPLAVPEIGLAVFLENILDGTAGGELDFVVGVDERHFQPGGEPLADIGFAGAHQADQDDELIHDGANRRLPPGGAVESPWVRR